MRKKMILLAAVMTFSLTALSIAGPSDKNDLTVLHYAGHYYLMKNDQLFQVPRTKLEYERNPYAMDTPTESKDFLKLVLNNKN